MERTPPEIVDSIAISADNMFTPPSFELPYYILYFNGICGLVHVTAIDVSLPFSLCLHRERTHTYVIS